MGPASPDKLQDQSKMMEEIARASQESVLLESYRTMMPISLFVKPGKQPYYRVLIAAEQAGYTWELGDGTLRMRRTIGRSSDLVRSRKA